MWFRRNSKKHPQEMRMPEPMFLGEQDGLPERELKAKLNEFFRRDLSVRIAYLARVKYGEQAGVNIVLCLRTQFGPDPGLAEKIGRIFASMFGTNENLDLLFLNDAQENALRKVVTPFFETI